MIGFGLCYLSKVVYDGNYGSNTVKTNGMMMGGLPMTVTRCTPNKLSIQEALEKYCLNDCIIREMKAGNENPQWKELRNGVGRTGLYSSIATANGYSVNCRCRPKDKFEYFPHYDFSKARVDDLRCY